MVIICKLVLYNKSMDTLFKKYCWLDAIGNEELWVNYKHNKKHKKEQISIQSEGKENFINIKQYKKL